MNIAIITPVFSIAGVPLAQHRFARALAEKNHKVDLIIGFLPSEVSPEAIPGVRIIILNKNSVLKMFFSLTSIFRKKKYDVLFSAEDHLNIIVIFARFFSRSKSLLSVSSRVTPYDTYSNIWFTKRWILKQLTKITIDSANVMSCVSKDMVLQYKSIFKNSPHQCIYNIVDDPPSRQKMHESVEHDWLKNDRFKTIVASGRLAEWKGFEDLIRAIPIILKTREVKLLILGDGPLKEYLSQLVHELNLNMHIDLVGYVNNPFKYYKNADVFVLSSYVEGLPNVLVEAMMCGCTPVSTDCPTGTREVIQNNKYGYLVPVKNPQLLAAGVINALENPISKDLLDEAIKPFSADNVIKSHFSSLNLTIL